MYPKLIALFIGRGRMRGWTPKKVIDEIHRRDQAGLPISSALVNKDDPGLYKAGRKFWGSWPQAVAAAQLPYPEITKTSKKKKWDADKIMVYIQQRHAQGLSLKASIIKQEQPGLYRNACLLFDTWLKALKATGVDSTTIQANVTKGKWTAQSVIIEIHNRIDQGFQIDHSSIKADNKSLYQAACRIFGSWNLAIEAAGLDPSKFSRKRGRPRSNNNE